MSRTKQRNHPNTWRMLLGGMLIIGMSGIPMSINAATTTTNFTVSATVLSACTVQATNLSFGNYLASSGAPLDATSSITITCTNGEDYSIALNAGAGAGATVAARSMTSGSDSLPYGLYTTTGRTTVWGDGSSSTATVDGTGNGTQQAHTVFGRIPASQFVPAGAYTDTILVTVTF